MKHNNNKNNKNNKNRNKKDKKKNKKKKKSKYVAHSLSNNPDSCHRNFSVLFCLCNLIYMDFFTAMVNTMYECDDHL